MPEIKEYMEPERFQELALRLKNNRYDLMGVDRHVLSYAFGFDEADEYYKYVETKGRLHNI